MGRMELDGNGPPTLQVSPPPNTSTTSMMWLILANAQSNDSSADLGTWTLAAPTVEIDGQVASGQMFGTKGRGLRGGSIHSASWVFAISDQF